MAVRKPLGCSDSLPVTLSLASTTSDHPTKEDAAAFARLPTESSQRAKVLGQYPNVRRWALFLSNYSAEKLAKLPKK